jgi:hypothetical protein
MTQRLPRLIIPALIPALTMLYSCNDQPALADKQADGRPGNSVAGQPVLDKLVGTWRSKDGKSFERWTKQNDNAYSSVAFSIEGNDTAWNEHANIYPQNGKWVFENTVTDQNNGKAVKFISSFISDNSVQFSNPAHDFPTDVNYTLADSNTVNAFIVGPDNKGGRDTIPFNYTRVLEK